MRIDESMRDVLNKARYSIIEIGSIRRTLEEVQVRLYDSVSSSKIGAEERTRGEQGDARDGMIARKDRLFSVLRNVLNDHTSELTEAEKLIESIGHAGTRSALRYYYLCGVKTWEEVADLCHCDPRTVRRWVGEKICEK